jgi:hypothetical protein
VEDNSEEVLYLKASVEAFKLQAKEKDDQLYISQQTMKTQEEKNLQDNLYFE